MASSVITLAVLAKLVVGALAAGLGVTAAFSLLIYCTDRAQAFRTSGRRHAVRAFQAGSALAFFVCLAIISWGLILTISKPK